MKKIILLYSLAGIIALASCSTSGKTATDSGLNGLQQKQFSSEQIEIDALAMADINCQWEVAKYNAALQENNSKLQKQEKKLRELKFQMEQKMKIRYMQIENLEKKFNKALEKAHKQLSACAKLDDIREMEEAKKEKENP